MPCSQCEPRPGGTKENPSMRPLGLTCCLVLVLKDKTQELQAGYSELVSLPPPTSNQLLTIEPWAWDQRELDPNPYFRDHTPTPSQSLFLSACLSPTVPSWDCSTSETRVPIGWDFATLLCQLYICLIGL